MKILRNFVITCLCLILTCQPVLAGYGEFYDLGSGWRFRIDGSHYDGGKPHVHVYNDEGEVAAENLDGTPSHGSSLDDLPNSVKKRVKGHPEYKKKKKSTEKKTSLIVHNLDAIRDALAVGSEVVVIGGFAFSVYMILDWAAKLGLIFLFV